MRSLSWVAPSCVLELGAQIVILSEMSGRSLPAAIVGIAFGQVAVLGVAFVGRRLAGRHFGATAAAVFALLPLLGIAYSLTTYRHTFVHEALPVLVGLHHPAWFAAGAVTALAFAFLPRQLVAAAGGVAAVAGVAAWGFGPLSDLRNGLHETVWSITFGEWALVAGLIGATRRSALLALGLGGWVAFFLLRAAAQGYDDATFWKSLAPATPAIALLLSALWFLVPRLRAVPSPYQAP